MTTYVDLLARREELNRQKAQLEQAILAARREAQATAVAEIKKLMVANGLTLEDLGVAVRGRRVGPAQELKSKMVAPKYRNNETGETWSGRGLKPHWIRRALEAGQTLEDFKI